MAIVVSSNNGGGGSKMLMKNQGKNKAVIRKGMIQNKSLKFYYVAIPLFFGFIHYNFMRNIQKRYDFSSPSRRTDNIPTNNAKAQIADSPSFQANSYSSQQGPVCESWPISTRSLPMGATVSNFVDGCNAPCKGLITLLWHTFALSFPTTKKQLATYQLPKENTEIDCSDFASSTVLFMKRVNDKLNPYSAIRQCKSRPPSTTRAASNKNKKTTQDEEESEVGTPFITFRSTPKSSILGPSELSSKAGLAEHVRRYLPCNDEDNGNDLGQSSCIMPETFSISKSEEDCKRYFGILDREDARHNSTLQLDNVPSSTTKDSLETGTSRSARRVWVKKPLKGRGGSGIERLFDPQQQLLKYHDRCSDEKRRKKLQKIVVQQYIKPLLILDGRTFHIRVYFAYKFPSLSTTSTTDTLNATKLDNGELSVADPAQAWHIKVGNIHVCSEPYSKIDDPELGSYAVKCNGLAWSDNPRIQRDYNGDVDEYLKANPNITFLERYPQYFEQTFSKDKYQLLMKRIDTVLSQVGKVLQSKAMETNTYGVQNEALWTVIGVDLLIDETLRPWLLETNACPGDPLFYETEDYEKNQVDVHRNPYIAIYRLVMSHYKRHLMKDEHYDENICQENEELDDVVSRVL